MSFSYPSISPARQVKSPQRNTNDRKHIDFDTIKGHTSNYDQSLDQRNYPRRDVTHYESPPRRRITDNQGASPAKHPESNHLLILTLLIPLEVIVLKREEKSWDPLNTADRLLRYKMEANERNAALRKKQI